MKKVLFSMLAVALMATAANAALIGLQWKAAPASQSLDVAPGAPAVIQVYIQQVAGDPSIQGVGGHLNAWDNNTATTATTSLVSETAVAAPLPGWVVAPPPATTLGLINAPLTQFGTFDPSQAGTGSAAGKYILAEITIQHTEAADKLIYITWDRASLTLVGPGGAVLHDVNAVTWNATKAPNTSGYIAYGNWGNPGWKKTNAAQVAQPTANALILHAIPEPASLALLALGAFAAIRRR